MDANPNLTFPMPEGIPNDLRYPIVSYCNGKERNEVFVYTSDDAVANAQSYAPHFCLNQPLDHYLMYVQLDDEGQPTEVLTSPTDPIDLNSELTIHVGTTSEHPLHYFITHGDSHSSRHPHLYELYIRESLMQKIYSTYMRDFDLPSSEKLGKEVTLTTAQSDYAMFTSYQILWIKLGNHRNHPMISTDSADSAEWDQKMEVRYRDGQIWVSHESNPYGNVYMRYDLNSIVSHEALQRQGAES